MNVNQFFSVAEEERSVSVVDHMSLAPPPQVRAQLDQDKNITALVPRQPLEVHETVAECMIYANHWVARKIQEAFPYQALLRRHPQPRQELFSQLVDTAWARGFSMDTRWVLVRSPPVCRLTIWPEVETSSKGGVLWKRTHFFRMSVRPP